MVTIRKIEHLKASFFLGLFGVFAGVVIAVFQIILWELSLPLIFDNSTRGVIIPFFGFWVSIIFHPIFFGALLFLGGLIFIPLANLVLDLLKGFKIETGTPTSNLKDKQKG